MKNQQKVAQAEPAPEPMEEQKGESERQLAFERSEQAEEEKQVEEVKIEEERKSDPERQQSFSSYEMSVCLDDDEIGGEDGHNMKDAYFMPLSGETVRKNPLLQKQKCTCEQSDMRLLIVDKILQTYTPTKIFFERHGCHIAFAMTGQEALDICSEHLKRPCCNHFPHVIIINAELPDLSGCEVAGKIRDQLSQVDFQLQNGEKVKEPVVIIALQNGLRGMLESQEFLDSGASGVIQQPVLPSELVKKLYEYMDVEQLAKFKQYKL